MKSRPPLHGYNHNVRHGSRIFHVQTEDSGVNSPRLHTHLFFGGTILASKRSEYASDDDDALVQRRMQLQHKSMLKELRAGLFDERIAQFFASPAGQLAVAQMEARESARPTATDDEALDLTSDGLPGSPRLTPLGEAAAPRALGTGGEARSAEAPRATPPERSEAALAKAAEAPQAVPTEQTAVIPSKPTEAPSAVAPERSEPSASKPAAAPAPRPTRSTPLERPSPLPTASAPQPPRRAPLDDGATRVRTPSGTPTPAAASSAGPGAPPSNRTTRDISTLDAGRGAPKSAPEVRFREEPRSPIPPVQPGAPTAPLSADTGQTRVLPAAPPVSGRPSVRYPTAAFVTDQSPGVVMRTTTENVVVARPTVIVGDRGRTVIAGTSTPQRPPVTSSLANTPPRPTPQRVHPNIFGGDDGEAVTLDEAILAYLSDDGDH